MSKGKLSPALIPRGTPPIGDDVIKRIKDVLSFMADNDGKQVNLCDMFGNENINNDVKSLNRVQAALAKWVLQCMPKDFKLYVATSDVFDLNGGTVNGVYVTGMNKRYLDLVSPSKKKWVRFIVNVTDKTLVCFHKSYMNELEYLDEVSKKGVTSASAITCQRCNGVILHE
jgi:hypothetical protein